MIVGGGKQELFNVVLALVGPGDEVIIPVPYWVSFPDQVAFAGGMAMFARTDGRITIVPRSGLEPGPARPATRGVILNSPCNPTGAVIHEAELRRSSSGAGRAICSSSSTRRTSCSSTAATSTSPRSGGSINIPRPSSS